MMANFGSANSNMAFIFEFDKVFNNCSYIVTYCHFGVKRSWKMIKTGMMNSNMAFSFEIDKVFINYSYIVTFCHFGVIRSQKLTSSVDFSDRQSESPIC